MSCQELEGNTIKESEGSAARRSKCQATVQVALAREHSLCVWLRDTGGTHKNG